MSTDTNAERAKALGELIKAGAWNMQNGWATLCERVDALVAIASHPLPPVEGWQPIETAPKDRIILIGLPVAGNLRAEDRRVFEGRWNEGAQAFSSVNGFLLFNGATHWMPLPSAPTLPQEKT